MANPFSTLGLNPEIIGRLSDDDLAELVKSQWRALQRIYHPDKSSASPKKSQEINEAYELLQDPEIFAQFRKKVRGGYKKQRDAYVTPWFYCADESRWRVLRSNSDEYLD